MKFKLLWILTITISYLKVSGQNYNPFASLGKETSVVTLSNGKYEEFFDTDTIQRIGSILFNIRQKRIITLLDPDSLLLRSFDNSSVNRWYGVDPKSNMRVSLSPYNFVQNNPIIRIDPDGALDQWWYKDKNKNNTLQYDPNIKSQADLDKRHIQGTYVGETYSEKTAKGTVSYRNDGSILYSNQTDAYNRLWDNTKANSREQLGFLLPKGVLVLPEYKNEQTTSYVDDYGYKIKNSTVFDPVTKKSMPQLGTIHTHPVKMDKASAAPSIEDVRYFSRVMPNVPFMTMGWDMKIHMVMGTPASYNFIDLPPKYNTVNDLLKGSDMISLLNSNRGKH